MSDLVAEAFHVRDGPIRILIAELEAERAQERADALARRLGLRNRFELARLLSAEHVPSLTILRGILHVVTWTYRWENRGLSLAQQALSAGRDPAAWSKTVHHLTGRRWRDIREQGPRRSPTSWRRGSTVDRLRRERGASGETSTRGERWT